VTENIATDISMVNDDAVTISTASYKVEQSASDLSNLAKIVRQKVGMFTILSN
jgi:hypothetical protein